MMYAGIDYSLSCPAITIGPSKDFGKCKSFYYTNKKKLEGKFDHGIFGMLALPYEHEMERIENISEWAMSILKKFKVSDACIEDYSFGSKGRVFHIAENAGLLKWKMWKAGIKYNSVPPTSAKKYFTGKGNSGKDVMHQSFVKETGVDISFIFGLKEDSNPVSDIVDSYAMLCYGIDNY